MTMIAFFLITIILFIGFLSLVTCVVEDTIESVKFRERSNNRKG